MCIPNLSILIIYMDFKYDMKILLGMYARVRIYVRVLDNQ